VTDHVFASLARLLDEVPIAYLKWDHNRDLATAGATARYRRQVLATYALMARLRARYPDLEIEACAGGGGRIDAGIVRNTHRFWTSDNLDAAQRVDIQRGFLHFMPPELMGSHVGASPAHSTGRRQSMRYRGAVAMTGHFGVELDVRALDERDRARLGQAIAAYKAVRDGIHRGRTWLGKAGDGLLWQAHGDDDALVVQLIRNAPPGQRHAPTVRLTMLDDDRRYRVAIGDAGVFEASGAWLVRHGFTAPPMRAESAVIVRVDRV
jgi:alpha-galactosidase